VLAVEAKEKLLPGLVYAVMRQESGYDPEAVSPARAVGLLQLLPETAKTLAMSLELSHEDARLTSPPYNIALGGHYLRELVDRFHRQIPLAVGAYNAGPEAIARWASRAPGLELDVFVERIPYRETRDYVGRVVGNLARYGYLRNGELGVPKIDLSLAQ
jgi:soluble lytic murein transglycosylase